MKDLPIKLPLKSEGMDAEVKAEKGRGVGSEEETLDPLSFAHTLLTAPPQGTIIFIQMPDQFPVLDAPVDSLQVKEAKLSSEIGVVPEGYIGKIEIFSSGQSRLLLGQNTFHLRPAKPVSFRQVTYNLISSFKLTFLSYLLCIPIPGVGVH